MAPHVTAAVVVFLLTACLDDKSGLVALVGECPSGAAYSQVAEVDGDFAIGPCGEVVFWDEGVSRQVTFLSTSHRVLGRRADPGGYGGTVDLSPRGRRGALTSLRSDLGFGDVVEGDLPTAGGFSGDVTVEFDSRLTQFFDVEERLVVVDRDRSLGGDATWLRSDGAEPVGPMDVLRVPAVLLDEPGRGLEDRGPAAAPTDSVFYSELVQDDGPRGEAQVFVYEPGPRTARTLTVIERAWTYGDTVRTRDGFEVGRDGRRVIVTRECEAYPSREPCGVGLRRVIDVSGVASGAAAEVALDWREPVIGPKSIVAGSVDGGVAFFDEAGEVHRLERATLAAVLDDHVLVERDGGLLAFFGSGRGDGSTAPAPPPELQQVVEEFTLVKVSPGGRAAAVVAGAGGDGRWLGVWRDKGFASVAGTRGVTAIVAVYEDGVTLARTVESTFLVGAERNVVASWPTSCGSEVVRRGEVVWVATCDTAGGRDRLVRVDLMSRATRVIAEGQARSLRFEVSVNGAFVAASFVAIGGERRVLFAGAVSD